MYDACEATKTHFKLLVMSPLAFKINLIPQYLGTTSYYKCSTEFLDSVKIILDSFQLAATVQPSLALKHRESPSHEKLINSDKIWLEEKYGVIYCPDPQDDNEDKEQKDDSLHSWFQKRPP